MSERTRASAYWIVFGFLPGLAYQLIQDRLRPAGSTDAVTAYLLGIGPNALGGVSLSASFITVAWHRWGRRAITWAALAALACLWAWEGAQTVLPNGTFDPHDIAWTVPGVLVAWAAARLFLPNRSEPDTRAL